MAKGENIFRRRDGRWEARYIKGRELSGKIKYGYCYGKTYREAKEKAAKRKAALENGALLPTATTQKPFSSYCLEWLHTKKCTVKESTYIKYSTVVNKHIMPKLGECCPLGFTTELMDDFIKELQFEDELAPKTVHDILVVLHGILKFASSKFAGSFPAVEINYPKIGKKEMRVLSREEQARLVAYLNEDLDSCRFGILLALCTGIRIGELCALQWESVSTNDKAIRIAKTLQRLHDTSVSQGARTRIVIGPPKSDTSVRTIPMTEYATGLCRRMKPQSSAAYVLTGTEAFMEPRTLQYRLEKYTQACGLEGVHFHTLRHTFATRAVEVGFEVKSFYRITIFFACGIITAALTAQQIATLPNISQFIKVDSYLTVTRLSGFYGDPNFYSAHIAACLAGTQLLLCHEKSRRRQIVLAILALVLLYCGLLSASKSFIIVTACLFLLWVPILLEKGTSSSRFRLFVGLLCAGIIIASSSAFHALLQIVDDRFAQASNLSELTTGRTDLWRNYIHEFLNNPITLLFGEGYTSINLNNKASHNTLIQVVYQFGLIGMPLLISWVVISLRNLFTQLNAGHVKWKHALLMCVGVVLPWMGIDILQFDEFFLLPVYAVIGIAYSTRSTENKKLESSKGEI